MRPKSLATNAGHMAQIDYPTGLVESLDGVLGVVAHGPDGVVVEPRFCVRDPTFVIALALELERHPRAAVLHRLARPEASTGDPENTR